jgi:shikimate dehydrogenase
VLPAAALEVWGDPVSHSLSPDLHRAAYGFLGWDWTYDRRQVTEAQFDHELATVGAQLRGISCTMPLKAAAFRAAAHRDARATATGAANTLLLTQPEPRAFNTDIGGIVAALGEGGMAAVAASRILGAGSTATSALVALHELGAQDVEVRARRPDAAAPLIELGDRLGLRVQALSLSEPVRDGVELTVSTLPPAAALPDSVAGELAAAGGLLFDVAYGHGTSPLTRAWHEADLPVVTGELMLLHQAVLQIRIFATGDIDEPLPRESAVVDVMRRALMGG